MNGKRYLLDTNAVIQLLAGNPSLRKMVEDSDFLAISVIVGLRPSRCRAGMSIALRICEQLVVVLFPFSLSIPQLSWLVETVGVSTFFIKTVAKAVEGVVPSPENLAWAEEMRAKGRENHAIATRERWEKRKAKRAASQPPHR